MGQLGSSLMVKIVSFEAESNKGGLSKVREGWVRLESSFLVY